MGPFHPREAPWSGNLGMACAGSGPNNSTSTTHTTRRLLAWFKVEILLEVVHLKFAMLF